MFVKSSLTTEPSSMDHGIKKEEKTPQSSSLVFASMENRVENKALKTIIPLLVFWRTHIPKVRVGRDDKHKNRVHIIAKKSWRFNTTKLGLLRTKQSELRLLKISW